MKFFIGAYFFFLLRHADVAFVDQQWIGCRFEGAFFHFVRFLGIPYLRTEYLSFIILYDAGGPCRNAFAASAFPVHFQFVQVAVFQYVSREFQFPITVVFTFQAEFFLFLPAVESSNQKNLGSVGSPFTENPAAFSTMQTEVKVAGCKVRERLFSIIC